MSQFIGPENSPSTTTPLSLEVVGEYVLAHADEYRKDLEKIFGYVRDNYIPLKDYIEGAITTEVCMWVAEGLGYNYEDVAALLDKDVLKKLLGDAWIKF